MTQKRKLVGNSFALLVNRLVQSIATFVLTAAIARLRGADELGQYLLAFSYYFIFVSIVSQGLKTFFTRELARTPEETSLYFTSGTLLQFILSLLGYGALIVFVSLLPYNADTKIVCYTMGLTVIPFALSNVTEAIFQAQEKMHLIAFSAIPIYLTRLFIMIWVMQIGYGVKFISGIYAFSELLIWLVQVILIVKDTQIKWQLQKDFIQQTIYNSRTFFALDSIAMISSRIEILLLSILGNEFLVGLYGGVAQLLQPFSIIANSLAGALFPAMSKAVEQGREKQRQLAEYFIEILMTIGLPLTVGLFFLGEELLTFIYDPSFAEAALALKINAVILLIFPFTRALSNLLVANRLEKINLREVLTTTPIGAIAGVILVSQYQLIGAAILDPLMTAIASIQYLYATYNRLFTLRLWRILRRPLLVSLLMSITLIVLKQFQLNFALKLIIAIAAYSIFFSFISLPTFGAIPGIKTKFFKK
jgi:O-antigen/teichoic acid export membrane protein